MANGASNNWLIAVANFINEFYVCAIDAEQQRCIDEGLARMQYSIQLQ